MSGKDYFKKRISFKTYFYILCLGLVYFVISPFFSHKFFKFGHLIIYKYTPYLKIANSIESYISLYKLRFMIFKETSPIISNIVIMVVVALTLYALSKLKFKGSKIDLRLKKILDDVNLVYKEEVNGKKKVHVPKLTVNPNVSPKVITISKIHEKVEKNLSNYLNGLVEKLYKSNYIDFDQARLEPTGYPGKYRVVEISEEQLNGHKIFREIGWFRTFEQNGMKKEVYPEVEVKENEVVVNFKDITVTKDQIAAGRNKFAELYKVKLKSNFARNGEYAIFKYQTELQRDFNRSEISKKIDVWRESIVNPMKDGYKNDGATNIFLGELQDPEINYQTKIFQNIAQAPHFLIAGQTRSGKSKTVLSLVATLAEAYPDSMFYFGDGKNSVDYDPFADKFSEFPCAKQAKGADPSVELANVVLRVWELYQERVRLFEKAKESGNPCSTIVEYNKKVSSESERLGRIFLTIDEFASFTSSMGSVEKLLTTKETILYYIGRILREAAFAGVHVILASQRVQATDFPTPIKSNLTTWMIHAVTQSDAKYLGLSGTVEKLSTGHYILNVPGLKDPDTGSNDFEMSLPYIGDSPEKVLNEIDFKTPDKREFNYHLLYNTGEAVDFDKLDLNGIYKYVKQLFLSREGFEITEYYQPDQKLVSIRAVKDGRRLGLGFVDINELLEETFHENLLFEQGDNLEKDDFVWFVTGKDVTSSGKRKQLEDLFKEMPNHLVLIKQRYMRLLKEAYDLYKNNSLEPVFERLIEHIEARVVEKRETVINKMYDGLDLAKNYDLHEILEDAINEKSAVSKGDKFEAFYLLLERNAGFDTVIARELIETKIVDIKTSNSRSDGGVDLIRWVDKEKKIVDLFQLKNYPSKPIGAEMLSRFYTSIHLWGKSGVTVRDSYYVTSSKFTPQAQEEAKRLGIKTIDLGQIEDLLG